jgi:hypothetical protein
MKFEQEVEIENTKNKQNIKDRRRDKDLMQAIQRGEGRRGSFLLLLALGL